MNWSMSTQQLAQIGNHYQLRRVGEGEGRGGGRGGGEGGGEATLFASIFVNEYSGSNTIFN